MAVEDYQIEIRHGYAMSTGETITIRFGNRRKVTKYQETYQTPAGEFKPDEWHELVLAEVKADGKSALLEQVTKHCETVCAWLHTDDERQRYALECLANHAYEHWDDFKE